MSAVVLIAIGAVWLSLGMLIWTRLLRHWIAKPILRWILLMFFLALWMVGPWIDEILGAREFKRLCDEMPPIKFYGPVGVGPGVFFDENGRAKWRDRRDFEDRRRPFWAESEKLFGHRNEWKQVASFPVPIYDNPDVYFDRTNGSPVLVAPYRASPGGWIKRVTGWGSHAPYVCKQTGRFPGREEWLTFSSH